MRYKLKPKQWRTVGVADTFYNFNNSKRYLWIDSLSQSWTNPMLLLWAYGYLPCLKVVSLWYVSGIVSLSLHLSSWMGIFRLVLVMSFHDQDQYLMQKHLFRICSLKVLIQYQDLRLMITLCEYGAPWVPFYQLLWKL